MTLVDARQRVVDIWGPDGRQVDLVAAREDGDGWDVALNVLQQPIVRGRDFWYHHLNADGHAVCHADCADLEAARVPA